MQQIKSSEEFHKFYVDPDGYKLAGNGYELQKEPNFIQLHLFQHTPRIVKWYKRFPGCDPRFFEHSV